MYEFGAQQLFSTIDPTDQTEDLGDDHIKAGNYAISNLKILVENFDIWMMEKGQRYDEIDNQWCVTGKTFCISNIGNQGSRCKRSDSPRLQHYRNKPGYRDF